ncbi:MAG: two pore domain potassium channel family protein, partial [Pseudomonadota bacterium]
MFEQLILGATITLVSLAGAASIWWFLNELLVKMEPWLRRSPHQPKSFVVILMVAVMTMVMTAFGVGLWALVFRQMAVFGDFEEAVYYSLVAYTTLGLGDI